MGQRGGGGHVDSRFSPGRRPVTLRQGSASPWSPGETHQRAGGSQGRNQRLPLVPGDVEGATPQGGLCPCHTLWEVRGRSRFGGGGMLCSLQPPLHPFPHGGVGATGSPVRMGVGGLVFSARAEPGAPELTRLHALRSKRASPSTQSIATTTRAPAQSWRA